MMVAISRGGAPRRGGAVAATLQLEAGGNLQAALNAAQPGDEIVLEAGARFVGEFSLPPKPAGPVITIRSSAPVPDRRVTPAGEELMPRLASGVGRRQRAGRPADVIAAPRAQEPAHRRSQVSGGLPLADRAPHARRSNTN